MTTPTIGASEHRDRRHRARAAAAERGLDGLLVWGAGNTSLDRGADLLWLTGHHCPAASVPSTQHWSGHGSAVLVLPVDGEEILITSALDDPDAFTAVDDVRVVAHLPEAVADALRQSGLRPRHLGLAARAMGAYDLRAVERHLAGPLDGPVVDDLLDGLRAIKSPAELACVRHAVDAGVAAMDALMGAVEDGVTDADLVAHAAFELTRRGGRLFDVAIASGDRSAHYWGRGTPGHWNADRPLRRGDLLHADVWTPVDAYWTDFIRSTVVGGDPAPAQEEVLEASIGAVEAIVAALQPGVTCDELFSVGRSWLDAHGFGGGDGAFFDDIVPLFGHGLGLGPEAPFLSPGDMTPVAVDMVICVEAGATRAGVGASWFEHVVHVTANGPVILDAACAARPWR